jgi:predicted nuclease of predicted toxin-antitoxin system
MRIKLDENLPLRLAPLLQQRGYDVDTVPEEQLTGQPDTEIAGWSGCFVVLTEHKIRVKRP